MLICRKKKVDLYIAEQWFKPLQENGKYYLGVKPNVNSSENGWLLRDNKGLTVYPRDWIVRRIKSVGFSEPDVYSENFFEELFQEE